MITTLRTLSEIFPSFYTGISDEDTLRRMVDGYMDQCYDVADLYSWIERQSDPYRREACAVLTISRIKERTMDEDDDFRLSPQIYEERVLPALKRIIRYAQMDSAAEERLHEENGQTEENSPAYTTDARFQQLEEQVNYLTRQVHQLTAKPDTKLCTYIVANDIKSPEDIEIELSAAAGKDAPTLGSYLERAWKLGYLSFGRDTKKNIFDILRNRYHMSYTYDNFKRYFHY